jgi:hypothetical protein
MYIIYIICIYLHSLFLVESSLWYANSETYLCESVSFWCDGNHALMDVCTAPASNHLVCRDTEERLRFFPRIVSVSPLKVGF